jgi:hypothetical protein
VIHVFGIVGLAGGIEEVILLVCIDLVLHVPGPGTFSA